MSAMQPPAGKLKDITENDWRLAAPAFGEPGWLESHCEADKWLLQVCPDIPSKPKKEWSKLLENLVGGANGRTSSTAPVYFLVKTPLAWSSDIIVRDMFKSLDEEYALCSTTGTAANVGSWERWQSCNQDTSGVFAHYHITEHPDLKGRWEGGERWLACRVYPVGSKLAVVSKSKWRPGAATALRAAPLWKLGPAQIFSDHIKDALQGFTFRFSSDVAVMDPCLALPPEGPFVEYKSLSSPLMALNAERVVELMEEVVPSMIRTHPKFKLTIGVLDDKLLPHWPVGFILPPDTSLKQLTQSIIKRLEDRWQHCIFPSTLAMNIDLCWHNVWQPHEEATQFYGPIAYEGTPMKKITPAFKAMGLSASSGSDRLLFCAARTLEDDSAVLLLNKKVKQVSLDKYDVANICFVNRYVLEIQGSPKIDDARNAGEVPVRLLCENMFIDNYRLQVGQVLLELDAGSLIREPAMHAWLRLNHTSSIRFSSLVGGELYHRCILSRTLDNTRLNRWVTIGEGDIVQDSIQLDDFLAKRAATFCVVVVNLCSSDDPVFWCQALNNLRKVAPPATMTTTKAIQHWKIILVSKWGSYLSAFASQMRMFDADAAESLSVPEAFQLYDARLSDNLVLCDECQPANLTVCPGISVVPARDGSSFVQRNPPLAVIEKAKEWIKFGSPVPWEVISAELVGEAPNKMHCALARQVCETLKIDGMFKQLFVWKRFKASGATTMLRATAHEVQRAVPTAQCIVLSNTFSRQTAQKLLQDCKRLFVCIDDSVAHVDAHTVMGWLRGTALSVVVVQVVESLLVPPQYFYKRYAGHQKPVALSPIVQRDCIPALVDALKTLYPYSETALQKMISSENLSKSQRNLHNFILTAVHGITGPISEWIQHRLEHYENESVPPNLLTFIALTSAFTLKRGLVLSVTKSPSKSDPLAISGQMASMLLAPGELFVVVDQIESKTEVRIWNILVSQHILEKSMPKREDVLKVLAKLLAALDVHYGAESVASVCRRLLIDARREKSLLAPILEYHKSGGGTWAQLAKELEPGLNAIKRAGSQQHFLIAVSRACVYYQPTRTQIRDAKAMALEATNSIYRGEDRCLVKPNTPTEERHVQMMAWNNYATLCLVNQDFEEASEIFCKIVEQHDNWPTKKAMTIRQALHGKKYTTAEGDVAYFYQGLANTSTEFAKIHQAPRPTVCAEEQARETQHTSPGDTPRSLADATGGHDESQEAARRGGSAIDGRDSDEQWFVYPVEQPW